MPSPPPHHGGWGLGKDWHVWTGPQDIADRQGSLAKEALAVLDASLAKLRILQLPSLLGVASILGVTALAAQLWLTA